MIIEREIKKEGSGIESKLVKEFSFNGKPYKALKKKVYFTIYKYL